jgi:hypothetical protein
MQTGELACYSFTDPGRKQDTYVRDKLLPIKAVAGALAL